MEEKMIVRKFCSASEIAHTLGITRQAVAYQAHKGEWGEYLFIGKRFYFYRDMVESKIGELLTSNPSKPKEITYGQR